MQDGTWEPEDDEEEAWESGSNGWDVSPTLLVLELPLLAYKGIMCVALFCLFRRPRPTVLPGLNLREGVLPRWEKKKKKPLNPAAMAGM